MKGKEVGEGTQMIVQKEFLAKLKDFGLNSYESKLWTALLSRGVSTAGELSDIAGVPRSRSYDVLESLEKKGFIIMKLGKPIRYIAVPPGEVLERVRRKVKEDADRQTHVLEELSESKIISDLIALHSKGIDMVDPADLTGFLKGRENIYHHFESTIKSATSTISLVTTEEGLIRKFEYLLPALKKAHQKGVKIRVLAPKTKKNQKMWVQLKEVADIKNGSVEARFMITDHKHVIFLLLGDEIHPNYDVGVVATTDFFAQSMGSIFDILWQNSK